MSHIIVTYDPQGLLKKS